VSALQKAIRRSQVKAAAYWTVELFQSGYGTWLWSRMKTIASEDIGPAERNLPAQIETLHQWSERERKRGRGGGSMEAVHAAILLATAKKSRLACRMVISLGSNSHERYEIPDEALDKHTRRGRQMGRGIDHFLDEAARLIDPPEDVEAYLKELEVEYDQHRRRMIAKDETLPKNPWAESNRSDTAERSRPQEFGQLRIGTQEDER